MFTYELYGGVDTSTISGSPSVSKPVAGRTRSDAACPLCQLCVQNGARLLIVLHLSSESGVTSTFSVSTPGARLSASLRRAAP